jgi:hypothetical protein
MDVIAGDIARDICRWQNTLIVNMASEYIHEQAKIADNLIAHPVPSDDGVHSYCPRCHSQFKQAAGHCPDCTGVKLMAFETVDRFHNAGG